MNTKKSILWKILVLWLFLVNTPVRTIIEIKPELFIQNDLIFPNGGNDYFYAAGYYTNNAINTYLKNQGYSLAHDTSVTIYIYL